MMRLKAISVLMLALACVAAAQMPAPTLSGDQVVERVAPSVALVLVGDTSGQLTGVGSGVIVRADGIVLTAYHGVKNATAVQVRLKNGEIYDQVMLVGVDKRRDVAALRVIAANLPVVEVLPTAAVKPGASVYVVANGAALPWSASAGVLSATRLADEIADAGSGYRLLQFTAPISPGSSGGVLVDTQGRAIGIVVASLAAAQNVNFAVPLDSVLGLASLSGGTTFASGAALNLPKNEALPEKAVVKAEELARSPVPEAASPQGNLAAPATKLGMADTANSQPIESRDPAVILRTFRSIHVDSRSKWLKSGVMKSAIHKRKEFGEWGIAVVDEPGLADLVLRINLVGGTEDYTYELQHQNTSIVVSSGKVRGFTPILWMSGNAAAPKIAEALVKTIKAAGRAAPSASPDNEGSKKEKKG